MKEPSGNLKKSNSKDQAEDFSWEITGKTLVFRGNLVLAQLNAVWKTIHGSIKKFSPQELILDLEELDHIDSAGIAFLQTIKGLLRKQNKKKK